MALTAVLVPDGLHHARIEGTLDVGPGVGQVPAVGLNQLLQIELPFAPKVYVQAGFEEQLYALCGSPDGFVTDIRPDAVPVVYPVGQPPRAQFRVDLTSAPASVKMWLNAEYSASR
jgi:hypothetical protein